MAYAHAERLSALDTSFLALEDEHCHMHIGAVAIFDAAPLRTASGGIDVDRIRSLMEAGLHRIHMLAWRDLDDPEAGGSELHASTIARMWAEGGIDVTVRTSTAAGLWSFMTPPPREPARPRARAS